MVSFGSVAVIAAVALIAPLTVGLARLRLPAIVLEILLGIAVGPQGLGWAKFDEPVEVMSMFGLAFLLLLAGLEIDFDRLRGRLLRTTALGFAVSFALALVVGFGLRAGDLVRSPLLIAVILSATGLGVILPILKDAGLTTAPFGQVVVAGASIAEVTPIVLLSLFFSGESGGIGGKLVLLVGFFLFVAAIGVSILGAQHSMKITSTLLRLQDTTAEIRVRGAFLLLALFVVLASKFGLEAILGAFLAGATLKLVDRDEGMTHAFFHRKLEAAGFGVFVLLLRLDGNSPRRRQPLRQRVRPGPRPDLPRSPAPGSRVARALLPSVRHGQATRGRRPVTGHVAEHSGRRRPDRGRPRADPADELRRAGRRGADLRDRVPLIALTLLQSGPSRRPRR